MQKLLLGFMKCRKDLLMNNEEAFLKFDFFYSHFQNPQHVCVISLSTGKRQLSNSSPVSKVEVCLT